MPGELNIGNQPHSESNSPGKSDHNQVAAVETSKTKLVGNASSSSDDSSGTDDDLKTNLKTSDENTNMTKDAVDIETEKTKSGKY